MMRLKYLGAVAIGALLATGGAKTAEAVPAYAYAEIQFSNFDLNLSQVTVTGSTVQGFTSTNDNGYTPTSVTTPGDLTTGVASPAGYSGPLGVNFASSGLAAGTAGGANWGPQLTTNPGAQAQQLIAGAISGASSYQVSEAHLIGSGQAAGASTDANTVITVNIAALAGQQVSLTATALTSLLASFGTPGDIANASTSATFKISTLAGAILFQDSNPALNNPLTSVQALFAGVPMSYDSGPVAINDLYTFTATGDYAITLYDNSTANVVTVPPVPEPVSAAILGSGLALLGLMRRRAKI